MKGPVAIREMFDEISKRYDLSNTIMTFGMDRIWRAEVIRIAGIEPGMKVLDVGTGTGKLLKMALSKTGDVVGMDVSRNMLRILKGSMPESILVEGDATQLPFQDESFDRVISAFVLRNVGDLLGSLREQVRVLKKKGVLCALDTMPISPINPFAAILRFYFKKVVPIVGQWVAKNRPAFQYLYTSTMAFRPPEEMKILFLRAGLRKPKHKTFALGTVAVYYGIKP